MTVAISQNVSISFDERLNEIPKRQTVLISNAAIIAGDPIDIVEGLADKIVAPIRLRTDFHWFGDITILGNPTTQVKVGYQDITDISWNFFRNALFAHSGNRYAEINYNPSVVDYDRAALLGLPFQLKFDAAGYSGGDSRNVLEVTTWYFVH